MSNRSTIFVVRKDCKVYMSVWQVSSDLDLIFMIYWSMFSFNGLVRFLDTISNSSAIFDTYIDGCKVYMSVWYDSSDLESILMIHWSMFSFLG